MLMVKVKGHFNLFCFWIKLFLCERKRPFWLVKEQSLRFCDILVHLNVIRIAFIQIEKDKNTVNSMQGVTFSCGLGIKWAWWTFFDISLYQIGYFYFQLWTFTSCCFWLIFGILCGKIEFITNFWENSLH